MTQASIETIAALMHKPVKKMETQASDDVESILAKDTSSNDQGEAF